MKRKRMSFCHFSVFHFASLLVVASGIGAEEQVTRLVVRHHEGQTFITWREVNPPEVKDDIDAATLKKVLRDLDKSGKVRYRIYRSDRPIVSVDGMTSMAEVGPLSCWNAEYYGVYPKQGQAALRYVVRDGQKPLANGIGLYVHNPKKTTKFQKEPFYGYYAITCSKDSRENTSITSGNATRVPVKEYKGQGVPVLQRKVKPREFAYIKSPELHYYVRWEAPPNASVEGKPIDYLVAVPPYIERKPTPVGLHLHCWGGSLNGGYGWWYSYDKAGTTYLISSNQIPYDWWTGYHEFYYSGERNKEQWEKGFVRPYTTTRMLSFLDWATKKYNLDTKRVFTAGSSMGGSGSVMFAIRHSERIAWSVGWMGVHDAGNTPQFTGSYERVYGNKDWRIKFEDGTDVFEYYKDAAYLRKYPNKEIGFITWSNGKNDGGIGWPQAVEFYEAMQETRRPHIFVWGLSGHGQRAKMPADGGERIMPLDIRLDQSLPAFTNCSLDDEPGTAKKLDEPKDVVVGKETKKDYFDGAAAGQVNLYLYWETNSIIDTAKRWELTVGLTAEAPKAKCTVDITPRRLQQFKAEPDDKFRWSNTSRDKKVQSSMVTADKWGLTTLREVIITKAGNRIVIRR